MVTDQNERRICRASSIARRHMAAATMLIASQSRTNPHRQELTCVDGRPIAAMDSVADAMCPNQSETRRTELDELEVSTIC